MNICSILNTRTMRLKDSLFTLLFICMDYMHFVKIFILSLTHQILHFIVNELISIHIIIWLSINQLLLILKCCMMWIFSSKDSYKFIEVTFNSFITRLKIAINTLTRQIMMYFARDEINHYNSYVFLLWNSLTRPVCKYYFFICYIVLYLIHPFAIN